MSGRPPVRWSLAAALLILALGLVLIPPTTSLGQDTTPPPTGTWQTYDDTDPRLVYENGEWNTFTVSQAAGGTLTGTASPGARLRAYFEGTAIRVIYSSGPEGGSFEGRINNEWAIFKDAYASSYTYGHLLIFEGLESGQHELTLTNGDGAIWMEALEIQGRLLSYEIIEAPGMTPIPVAEEDSTDVEASSIESMTSVVFTGNYVFKEGENSGSFSLEVLDDGLAAHAVYVAKAGVYKSQSSTWTMITTNGPVSSIVLEVMSRTVI